MIRRPPRSTRTDTLFPYTTLFRSILIEEWQHHVLAELRRGIAIPFERAARAAFAVDLAVAPRTHDQEIIPHLALRLQRFPTRDRAVHVLLVPPPLFPQGRDVRGVGRDHLVDRLLLPAFVIGDMLEHLLPEGKRVVRPEVRRVGQAYVDTC